MRHKFSRFFGMILLLVLLVGTVAFASPIEEYGNAMSEFNLKSDSASGGTDKSSAISRADTSTTGVTATVNKYGVGTSTPSYLWGSYYSSSTSAVPYQATAKVGISTTGTYTCTYKSDYASKSGCYRLLAQMSAEGSIKGIWMP